MKRYAIKEKIKNMDMERKTALRKAFDRMSGRTLSKFVERYAEPDENDKV